MTAVATFIGSYGFGIETVADITFDAAGTLYGWMEPVTDDLVTIDLGSGTATVVGDFGESTRGSGLSFDGAGGLLFAGRADSTFDGVFHFVDPGTGAIHGRVSRYRARRTHRCHGRRPYG